MHSIPFLATERADVSGVMSVADGGWVRLQRLVIEDALTTLEQRREKLIARGDSSGSGAPCAAEWVLRSA